MKTDTLKTDILAIARRRSFTKLDIARKFEITEDQAARAIKKVQQSGLIYKCSDGYRNFWGSTPAEYRAMPARD